MTLTAKRMIFWSVTLLLPFALLAALELCLRVTGTFAPEPLCVEVPDSHGALLKFNPWVTRRYFDSTRTILPNIAPEIFTSVKPAKVLRILCVGESTTAGFPFEAQVPFPAQLRELIAHAYPDRRVEVLNAGISAISSYVVLDLLPELLEKTTPDVVVAYLGHNEFYGVYGSGSTLFPAQKRVAVTMMLRLQHLRITQMVMRMVRMVSPRSGASAGERTLMQDVVGDQEIALGSRQYTTTMETFSENLETFTDLCRDRGVPLVLSTLVSNLADQPPFHSLKKSPEEINAVLREGDALLAAGQTPAAEGKFYAAWQSDSANADAWFGLGRARLAQGDSVGALRWFLGAKDRDAIRFRATEEANDIIAAIAARKNVRVADIAGSFRRASPGGIIGGRLMCDHLHPNPQGYYLMASAFCREILALDGFPPPDPSFVPPQTPYGVTDLDWEIGLVKIFPMIHEWPFRQVRVTRADYHPHGDTAATQIALEYLHSRYAWTRAHDNMAQVYIQRRDLARARNEYLAVAVRQPDSPRPYEQIAGLFEAEGDWGRRSAALLEALARSPLKGMLTYQLAQNEWKRGRLPEAIRAMEVAASAPEFKPEERDNALFYLAGFLSDSGQRERAREVLRSILSRNPSFVPARQFLSKLERTP